MILSTSKKFIFIHVPKTAGWSMMDALTPVSRAYRRSLLRSFSRRLPIRESAAHAHFRVHETAAGMIRKLGRDQFDTFFSFAFVRNPFDHAVSHYEYMKQYRIAATARKVAAMSFEEYLRYRQKRPFWNDNLFSRCPDQTYFIEDAAGNMAIDKVLHFETLKTDFDWLVDHLDLEGAALPYVNKTRSKSESRPMQSYYTDTARDLVLEIYDRDFDNFGYSRVMAD